MSEYHAPHYMETYYKSRIAELERQLAIARAELARIALKDAQ